MNRLKVAVLLSAFMALVSITVVGDEKPAKGFMSILKEGQAVTVRELAGRYEISRTDGVPQGHKITEVGSEFIVVEDIAGVTETRIHVCSIRAIVKFKVLKK